jgi:hypothetical protein
MDDDLLACIVAAVGKFVHSAALPTMSVGIHNLLCSGASCSVGSDHEIS